MSPRLARCSDYGLPMGQSSLGASLILSFGPDFGYFGFVRENDTRVPGHVAERTAMECLKERERWKTERVL